MTSLDPMLVDSDSGFLAAVHHAIDQRFLDRFELGDPLLLEIGTEVADKLGTADEWDTVVDWIRGTGPAPSVVDAVVALFPAKDRESAAKLVGVIIRWYAPPDIGHRLDLLVAGV